MKRKLILKSIIGLFIFVAMPFAASADSQENIFYYFPSERSFESVENNYKNIDILAPQIYTMLYELGLSPAEDEKILEFAKDKKMDVMPLVVNANFNKASTTEFLKNNDLQDEIIEALIEEGLDRDFIGWQFDFENINHNDRDRYTDFIEKAYKEFQKEDLLLSVAVVPGVADYDKNAPFQDWTGGYNVKNLATTVDFITLMSYDDPRSKGPVAAIDYVEKTIKQAKKDKVPGNKISLGIPFYCWQYELGNAKKIASVQYEIAANTMNKYKEFGVGSLYLEVWEAEIFVFNKPGAGLNYIWCDNVQSFKAKKQLVDDYNLRGISGWALGQEDKRIWKEL